jgi:hypothetical protein
MMRILSVCLVTCAVAGETSVVNAAVTLDGNPYSQNFDSLSTTAWENNSTLPGWSLFKQPAPGTAFTSIVLGTGSSNAGGFFSFGLDTDRALGGVGSGNATVWNSPASGAVAGWITAQFTNGASAAFDSFTVAYDGEQWRNGGNASAQSMVFEYGFGPSFDAISWTPGGATFDVTSPVTGTTASALDGNAAANRVAGLGGTISDLAWAPGDSLWIRWIKLNDIGNDHGLAIDNFSISTTQGDVTPVESGDFNGDGFIDAADYTIWRDNENLTGVGLAGGDGNNDGTVDALDYAIWSQQYAPAVNEGAAAIPEPGSLVIAIACLLAGARKQRARN